MQQLFDTTKEGRAITKALRSLLDKAKAAGIGNASLYFEPESGAVFVFDRNDPAYSIGGSGVGSAQPAVRARCAVDAPFDAGAW